LAALAVGACVIAGLALGRSAKGNKLQSVAPANLNPSLDELLAMSEKEPEGVDIGLMNLRCAEGLRGTEGLDVPLALQRLDQYADHVDTETRRYLERFRKNPANYNNSEAFYRCLVMATVMQEDFKIQYNPEHITSPDVFETNDNSTGTPRMYFSMA